MEKVSNFTIFFITISVLVIVVITCTTIKINNIHEEKLLNSMNSKIEYYAKRCYLEKKCEGDITLKDLYEKKYLEEIINPITKEVVDYDTSITYKDGKIVINYK